MPWQRYTVGTTSVLGDRLLEAHIAVDGDWPTIPLEYQALLLVSSGIHLSFPNGLPQCKQSNGLSDIDCCVGQSERFRGEISIIAESSLTYGVPAQPLLQEEHRLQILVPD